MDWNKVIQYFRDECDVSSREEVEIWSNASETNRKTFMYLKEIWMSAEHAPEKIYPDIEKAWNNVRAITGIKDNKLKPGSKKLLSWQIIKIAALFILVFGAGVIMKVILTKESVISVTNVHTEKMEIRLDDGTVVTLNRNSGLSYPRSFSRHTRNITLHGNAWFQVARDSLRPFIVHAGGTVTRVLGTSFTIKMNNVSQVVVSVLNGKVAFQPEHKRWGKVMLMMGQQGVYDKTSHKINRSQITDENYFSRETGILTFDNQSLEDAAKVLSAHFSRAVDVQPGLQDRTITVTFNNQPLGEILKILELTLHIGIDSTAEKILLKNASLNQ